MTDVERDAFDTRPSAEEMLARIATETESPRGRLRVYLGMAPGVGKTYRMLEEAHRRVDRGTDLVVGFVEPHGRARTAALLDGLELVPRLRLEYRGVTVEEMDTDAILARAPTVALVDELAHTNVPGSPRDKRWEDVELIRDAGIHVISTCNVQHLDSVADAVATITGAPVHERLPDEVLEGADEVELVDMSPHALRQRMRHGNVYPPDRTQVALDRFFTEPNLTALRDISLRFVAGRVDAQLEGIATGSAVGAGRALAGRIAVLVDGTPATHLALRRAAALASVLRATLLAVVVVTPESERRGFDAERDLRENLGDATDLGAQIVRVEASDTAEGLVEVVTQRHIGHVVLPHHAATGMGPFRRRSIVDELMRRVPGLEIHITGAG